PTGAFAYFGTDDNPAKVVKIDLANFTRVGSITLNSGEGILRSAVVDPAGHFAYFGTAVGNTTPGRVVKIDLGTFARVGALTIDGVDTGDGLSQAFLYSAVMAPDGGHAYFGVAPDTTFGTILPSQVAEIDLATF